MARTTGPKCKQCRREGMKLFLKGERCLTEKCGIERRSYPPGQHGRGRTKQSEYLTQLREKQKAKRYYGVLEKQFRNYYEKASRRTGITGENLLRFLELPARQRRLPARASRRRGRRPASSSGTATSCVNGRRVNIPRFQLGPTTCSRCARAPTAEESIRDATDLTASVASWLQADHDNLTGKVLRHPDREEIDTPVQEQLIVELYSK